MLEGIDVSNHQQFVDWAKVAGSGRRFGFVKAVEGTWYQDPYFRANWQGLANEEMWRGAYAFARPGRTPSGAAEAHYFCDTVLAAQQLVGDLYVIDLEEGPPGADLGAYLLDWCQTVEGRTGTKPLIYSTGYMLQHWKCDTEELSQYGLWLATPGVQVPSRPPFPWDATAFWQYDWHGRVPGVKGDCDLDRFNGSEEQLGAYGWGG